MKSYSYKFVICKVSAILSKEIWAKCVQKTKQWHVRVFNTIIVDEIKMVHWLRWQISSVTCWYIDLNVPILIHNGLGDKESESAGTRRNNNVFTTSTRRRRRGEDDIFASSLRYVSVGSLQNGLVEGGSYKHGLILIPAWTCNHKPSKVLDEIKCRPDLFSHIASLWTSCAYHRLETLQWCQNERDGFSNHRRLDCLHNRLFRRRSKEL